MNRTLDVYKRQGKTRDWSAVTGPVKAIDFETIGLLSVSYTHLAGQRGFDPL